MPEIHKITHGYVTQRWDSETKQFLGQEFKAGDLVEYQDENLNPIDAVVSCPYEKFDMLPPALVQAATCALADLTALWFKDALEDDNSTKQTILQLFDALLPLGGEDADNPAIKRIRQQVVVQQGCDAYHNGLTLDDSSYPADIKIEG